MTEQECIELVTQNGNAIGYLTAEQQTPDVCLAAVTQNGNVVYYLTAEQRTPDVKEAASKTINISKSDYYTLYRNFNGKYNAVCRRNLTLKQALKHWGKPRSDDRAVKFLAALEKKVI